MNIGVLCLQGNYSEHLIKLESLNFKPIKVKNVAKTMLHIVRNDYQKTIFESDEIIEISNL